MIKKNLIVSGVLGLCLLGAGARTLIGRGLYLNGEDITGARDEHLDGVRVRIDEKGDVWISGERYRVSQMDHYVPAEKKAVKPGESVHQVTGVNGGVTEPVIPTDDDKNKSILADAQGNDQDKKSKAEKSGINDDTQEKKAKQHPPELMMKKEMPAGNNPDPK